MRKIEKK